MITLVSQTPEAPFTNMAWITNYIHYKVWDEITHPFPNFNSKAVEVCEWMSYFIPHFTVPVIIYPCFTWFRRLWFHWHSPFYHLAEVRTRKTCHAQIEYKHFWGSYEYLQRGNMNMWVAIEWLQHKNHVVVINAPYPLAVNLSPPGQNGCHFGRRHFQLHFPEWKW